MKKKKILIAILIIGLLLLIAVGVVAGTMIEEYTATGKGEGKEITVVIEPGETVWDIAEKLKEKVQVDTSSTFKILENGPQDYPLVSTLLYT